VGRSFIMLLCFFVALAGTSQAMTITVRQDGTGDFDNLAQAVDLAEPGDEIMIGPGTWQQPVLEVDRDLIFSSEAGAELTILDGQHSNRLFSFIDACEVTVSDLTLTRALDQDGGAVHVAYGARVRFDECRFTENTATHVGGAGYVRHQGSQLTFNRCHFLENYAPLNAGGVGISLYSECRFFACVFEKNRSISMAGAIANFAHSNMVVDGCVFVDNEGEECGAIRVYGSPATITNNTFYNNSSGLGTVNVVAPDYLEFRNNIVCCDRAGVGLNLSTEVGVFMGCNIYHHNSDGAIEGSGLWPGDVETDPLFCAAESGDLSLCENSPATARNHSCGLIGALQVGCGQCGPVATRPVSWDGLKAMYRGGVD
jgi:hypothetical protein